MKKLILSVILLFAVSVSFSQNKLVKVVNESDYFINVIFDFNKVCYTEEPNLDAGETGVYKVRGNHYYKFSIVYYNSDRKRSIWFIRDSGIPYYAKDEDCKGTLITVHNGSLNVVRDVKYVGNNESGSSSWDVTQQVGCNK